MTLYQARKKIKYLEIHIRGLEISLNNVLQERLKLEKQIKELTINKNIDLIHQMGQAIEANVHVLNVIAKISNPGVF